MTVNMNNPIFPTIEGTCTAMIEEVKKQFPNMREGSGYGFNSIDMIQAFLFEFLTYQVTFDYLSSQIELIMSNLAFLFLESHILKPEIIETYELIDFSQFFKWIITHIKDQKTLQIVAGVALKFNELQLEFARRIESWNNNPDEISVPIKF